jgi:hypothetical protein
MGREFGGMFVSPEKFRVEVISDHLARVANIPPIDLLCCCELSTIPGEGRFAPGLPLRTPLATVESLHGERSASDGSTGERKAR